MTTTQNFTPACFARCDLHNTVCCNTCCHHEGECDFGACHREAVTRLPCYTPDGRHVESRPGCSKHANYDGPGLGVGYGRKAVAS